MDPVTTDDIRTWSKVDFTGRGYPTGAPDPLDIEVTRAHAYVEDVTGRETADVTDGSVMATRWAEAVQARTEQQVIWNSDDYAGDSNESAVDITVTGYSQRRIASKEQSPRDMVNPWPKLNDLLISLMTDEKREYWISLGLLPGGNTPAEVITEHGWFWP